MLMVTVVDEFEIDEGNVDFKRKIFSTVKTNILSVRIVKIFLSFYYFYYYSQSLVKCDIRQERRSKYFHH